MAIVDGSMRLVKHPDAIEQIAKPRSLKPMGTPFDFIHRAGPWFTLKYRPVPFRKLAVKAGVVGDHDSSIGNEGVDGLANDLMARHHFVADAVQPYRVFRDRFCRLIQRTEGLDHRQDLAA